MVLRFSTLSIFFTLRSKFPIEIGKVTFFSKETFNILEPLTLCVWYTLSMIEFGWCVCFWIGIDWFGVWHWACEQLGLQCRGNWSVGGHYVGSSCRRAPWSQVSPCITTLLYSVRTFSIAYHCFFNVLRGWIYWAQTLDGFKFSNEITSKVLKCQLTMMLEISWLLTSLELCY